MSASPFVGISILPHNDIHIDASGNLAMARGGDAVAQHVRQRLKFWRGEWFLDTEAGVDWTRWLLGRQPSEAATAEAVIKQVILSTPGVTTLRSFDTRYDRASRGFFLDKCEIEVTDGSTAIITGVRS
jgi:hypothetical protein